MEQETGPRAMVCVTGHAVLPLARRWRFCLMALITLCFAAGQVRGALLVYDPFDAGDPGYNLDRIGGQNPPTLGWWMPPDSPSGARAWVANDHQVRPILIDSKSLTHPGVSASSAPGSLHALRATASTANHVSSANRYSAPAVTTPTATNGQVAVWASYLLEFDLANQASAPFPFVVDMRFAPSFGAAQTILFSGIDSEGKPFIERGTSLGTGEVAGTSSLAGQQTHLFVLKAERDNSAGEETFSLWVNPGSLADETALGTPTATGSGTLADPLFSADGGDRFELGLRSTLRNNGGNSPQQVWLDEFRMGTTFADVVVAESADVAVPEPASLVLLVGGALMFGRRRRRG